LLFIFDVHAFFASPPIGMFQAATVVAPYGMSNDIDVEQPTQLSHRVKTLYKIVN